MTKLTLYGLKNCDGCKKAFKTLEAANVDVTFIDIRGEADLATKVPAWMAGVGMEALLNKRSTTWRHLSEDEKERALCDDGAAVLIANPTLIKRPVIEAGDQVLVGWTRAIETTLTS